MAGLGLTALASAQMPDVRIRLDGLVSLQGAEGASSTARLYDPLGNRGLVGITLFLEPGFRAYLAQRLQSIRNDPDHDPFDEYYLEDPGLWRIGKQYLPFGSGKILRESVPAARGDTNLILEGIPMAIAACDGGEGRPRGVVARFGGRIGLSVAWGRHFGINATALTYVRPIEAAPGTGRGWRTALGMDMSKRVRSVTFAAEGVVLRDGETALDTDEVVIDGSVRHALSRTSWIGAGLTRSQSQGRLFFRVHGSGQIAPNVWLEPLVRFADGELLDAGLALRVRL